ncbi:DNA polymerase lambda [Danio rerio]|uniref:DNA polymerase lambda n=1 Tax=Danio rerio TaxID=7955 RepID=Q6P0S1_DANRE|nr:DNA polymerase lambda [Danio rerio]AAH65469.1 Polymerase (DNA directed), lambda [Danio rerio]|eukprot:NP_998408.1 DNA polymerase lambda [Danio rerio]
MEGHGHGILKAFPKVKRARPNDQKDAPPSKRTPAESITLTGTVFQGVTIYIVPAGIGKARCDIFHRQITQNGGQAVSTFAPSCTHVVVDDSVDFKRALRLLKVDTLPSAVHLIKCTWLSACISEKRLLDTEDYSLRPPESPTVAAAEKSNEATIQPVPEVAAQDPLQILDNLDPHENLTETIPPETQEEYHEEDGVSQNDLEALISGVHPSESNQDQKQSSADKPVLPGKWVCSQPSTTKGENHNKHLTDKLEPLAKAYTHTGDKWRALGYSKAINALKSYHKPITSYEEACKIPGIGKRMADKIMEIMESGHLRKLDHIGEEVPVLEMFTNIWGAGAKTAQMWYQQGFRTLEDIRTKAVLNHTLRIGLKHYDDLLERMPRSEANAIEKTVKDAAHSVDPQLLAMACGSYRRGRSTCGDVDVLITHPDGQSHKGVFSKVLHLLHQSGFLTDDLVSHEENGEQKKYMGICRLPGPSQLHRRLDIIVVPYSEFACALLYFTGSAHFNRSMRALAKTKNMSLSEHSLNCAVIRQRGVKLVAGTPLHTPTEKNVFQHLGIPYREPHERDW